MKNFLLVPLLSLPTMARSQIYQDASQPIELRVKDLLSHMSLEDKIGQMTQAAIDKAKPNDVKATLLGSVLSGGDEVPVPATAENWADLYDEYQKAALSTPLKIPILFGKDDLRLDSEDRALVKRAKQSGVPTVILLVSGRPLDIHEEIKDVRALIASWLPGSEGRGVADILFGRVNPSGKLPMTWPRTAFDEPINFGDGKAGLFPLGFGLAY